MIPDKIMMLRPANFGFNPETASDNCYAHPSDSEITVAAIREFDHYANELQNSGVDVIILEDNPVTPHPDAVFLNNWMCVLPESILVLFPMHHPSRRAERTPELLLRIRQISNVKSIIDLTHYEKEGLSLEGTGSLVFDYSSRKVFVCSSQRSSKVVLDDFCLQTGYTPIFFDAFGKNGYPVYHTNVMLSITDNYVVICTDSIKDSNQRRTVLENLKIGNRIIIEISLPQMESFAGNIFQVMNRDKRKITIMSERARTVFTKEQLDTIKKTDILLSIDIKTVEDVGGGGARCMISGVSYQ